MTDDFKLDKEELAKKLTRRSSIDDAFDSDSSAWSEEENVENKNADTKDKHTVSTQPKKVGWGENSVQKVTYVPPQNSEITSDVAAKKDSESEPKGDKPNTQQLSLAAVIESDENRNLQRGENPVKQTAKAEVIKEHVSDDDDDNWDDDIAQSDGEGNVQMHSIKEQLQPSAKNDDIKELAPKDNNSIDWSPEDSIEDVVYVEEESNDNHEDKDGPPPQIEFKQSPPSSAAFANKSQSATNVDSVEEIRAESENTPVSTLFHSARAVMQESETSVESKGDDNFMAKMENEAKPGTSDESMFGRNVSSAHLFQASSNSVNIPPSTLKSVESIERDVEVASNANSKPSKSSSAGKRFLARFLSSDSSKKSEKSNTFAQVKRKSSEPTPLSTLLLDTPVKSISSAKSANDFSDVNDPDPVQFSDEATAGDANLKNSLAIPAKPNRFMKKMKRTFGVGLSGKPKSRSKSSNNLSTTSDPNVPLDQDDGSVIAVPVLDRPPEDIIMELLITAKKLAEQNCIREDDGGGDGQSVKQGELMQRSSTRLSMSSRASSEHSLDVDEEGGARSKSTSKMPLPYYCATALDNAPNREVCQAIVKDLECVISRSLNRNEALEGGYQTLGSELDRLRAELLACKNTNAELLRKLQELENEVIRLERCLDEQCQARANLEALVTELRAQIDRQDLCLDELCNEKGDLVAQLRQMEVTFQNMNNQLSDFDTIRSEYTRSRSAFEQSKGKCADLQVALAKCCEQYDNVQREMLGLRSENNDLKLKLDTCLLDKAKLLADIECMRQQFEDEKACLEAKICELLEANERIERDKNETCRKMNEILSAHHEEMDRLKTEADRFKTMFDEERKAREDLERKLRDCEEKKRNAQDPQANQAQIFSLQQDVARYKSLYEDQQKATESSEKKRRESEDKVKKASVVQHEAIQLQQQSDQSSKDKIDKLTKETGKYKDLLEEERTTRQTLERQVKDLEDQKRKSFQDKEQQQVLGNLQQQQQEFYLQQKIEFHKTEVDKYKNMYDEEKRGREDAERKMRDFDEHKLKTVHEQQVSTLQIQHQQQESLSQQKLELAKVEADKYKQQLEEEKRARENFEHKLRDIEDEKLRLLQEHQQALQHQQQQQEYYAQQRVDLLKNDLERNRIILEEEKRAREDLERKWRDADTEKQKIMLDHQAAVQKLHDQYSQLQTVSSLQSEEDKAARGVWQRELRDAQRLWEAEVKAKGILAEKLARLEKQQGMVDSKTKRELDELELYKDKHRNTKLALRTEKELVIRLTNKLEETKNLARTYKGQMDEMANDPKTQKLLAVVESLRSQFEVHSENARQEKEKLMDEIYKLNREKWNAERQSKKLVEELRILDAEKSTWQNLAKMKDRIELELVELKRAVNDQFVDKRDVEKIRNIYENKLQEVRSRYEQEVQSQVSLTLSQFTTQIGKQTRDRQMLDKIRDTNENTLRGELSTVTKSMQSDLDKFKSLISERDEEIVTLRKSLDIVNEKYASESRQRESLMRRLHILSSQDALVEGQASNS